MSLKQKKDDGNRQRNFVIPIVPVKKRKFIVFTGSGVFVSRKVPVKINENKK